MAVSQYLRMRFHVEKSLETAHKRHDQLAGKRDKASQVSAHFQRGKISGIMSLSKRLGFNCTCNLAMMKKKGFCHCKRR